MYEVKFNGRTIYRGTSMEQAYKMRGAYTFAGDEDEVEIYHDGVPCG